jgi:shikimate dehydrogenase
VPQPTDVIDIRADRRLLLGLIGAGIQQSRTPALHEREAAAHGIRCLYQLLDLNLLPADDGILASLLDAAERVGFAGVNITHPCKQSVLAHLTTLSDDAREMGAVNTVVFRDGRRIGYNTDWLAFRRSFDAGLTGASLARVVQLGAGGAGAATAYAVLEMGARHVSIVDSVHERAVALCERLDALFPNRVTAVRYLAEVMGDADGLIHATPTGMASHPGVPLPLALLRRDLWVADVVYFPADTPLLLAARELGCRTLDGTGMALWQAIESFRLFTGLAADPDRVRRFFALAGRP